MSGNSYLQIVIYLATLLALAPMLGAYMARVYAGERVFLSPVLMPLERAVYRFASVHADEEMSWTTYATHMLWFNGLGALSVYAAQRLQQWLPLNPERMPAVSPDSAFNTAISFATNTNWQGYAGEATMSYFTQMVVLAVQNFASAAVGMAVLVAFLRGFTRRAAPTIGNFWVDLVRSVVYVLLPLSLVLALILSSQGVVETFGPYPHAALVDPVNVTESVKDATGHTTTEVHTLTEQIIATGPVASQLAIKQLGTNGGGFFNVNSAHPFENPTPLSNFVEMLAILLIPAALCCTFGRMVGDARQGWGVLAAMTILFVAMLAIALGAEQAGNPLLTPLGINQAAGIAPGAEQGGGNMEGKELRFGIVNSALWATATSAASNGSVNAMHDSFTPLGGLVPMWLIQLGEVVFGGVGSGLYGMLVFAIIAVFVAGLMVGRTPEYLGKKIESFEMKMASIVILIPPFVVLVGTALAVSLSAGIDGISNPGPHGLSQVLYAFSSAGNNNGSAFAGLSANTPFYNVALGVAMWIARYWLTVPVLAIAGSLAAKRVVAKSAGTLPTHTPLFVGLLIGTVVIVGALTFIPALALGPVVEYLQFTGR
jgi:K+-transporting ATPase ATPase A chain